MRLFTIISALCLGPSLAVAHRSPIGDNGIIAHSGDPVGEEIVNKDNVTLYITGEKSDTAVLYLTDVFGIQLPENKLLADSFGRAGFLTVAPDLFNGTPAPGDINGTPNFNLTEFLEKHSAEVTDPLITSAIDYLKNDLGAKNIVATGYCFGGRYSFRVLGEDKGVVAAFAAHPSFVEDDEITGITGPISIAAAENDDLMPASLRREFEDSLLENGKQYSFALYSGTEHGFGVRANVSDPVQKFAKEEAFFQAARWFRAWA